VDLYGQEREARLLAAFLSRLEHRTVIDVGAERGAFAEAMLQAGADAVHVLEPEPDNVGFLSDRFGDDPRVAVHDCAASDVDGQLLLHRSASPDGEPLPFGHTVLERSNTDEIAWYGAVGVPARSLASLVESEEIPARVGVVKIDTEGHDFAVVSGMGGLDADVVMVEHWTDLPHSLGVCPWSTNEMVSALSARGFSHFAFVVHHREFVFLKWDDGDVQAGAMGNLVFLHDRVVTQLAFDVLDCASALAESAVELATVQASAAAERMAVIDELRLDRDVQAKAAVDRLESIEALTRELQERESATSP